MTVRVYVIPSFLPAVRDLVSATPASSFYKIHLKFYRLSSYDNIMKMYIWFGILNQLFLMELLPMLTNFVHP